MQSLGSCFSHQAVLELDAGKRPSGHHCVVPSAGAVRVELPWRQSANTRVQILDPGTTRTTKKHPLTLPGLPRAPRCLARPDPRMDGVLPFALQVLGGSAESGDAAGWRDVVCGHMIAQEEQRVSVSDGLWTRDLCTLTHRRRGFRTPGETEGRSYPVLQLGPTHQVAEEGRRANVGGPDVPGEQDLVWRLQGVPDWVHSLRRSRGGGGRGEKKMEEQS